MSAFVTKKPTKKCMEIKYNFFTPVKDYLCGIFKEEKCLFKHIAYNAMGQSHVRRYIHFSHIHREKKWFAKN